MRFPISKHLVITLFLFLSISVAWGQENENDASDVTASSPASHWYERIRVRGYTQVRYNRLLETNPDLQCEQCDRSWGGNGGIFFRRIRLIFSGQVHPRVFFYIQPDFASPAGDGSLNFAQIRDAYFDLGLDKKNEFRFRIGQSKVPYGFENLQSSGNRLPLDRNDAINSAFNNERDIGVFFYWAPSKIRDRFAAIANAQMKGSGDYGVFGFGFMNGQGGNREEENKSLHTVVRLSYPLSVGKQLIEPGIQAYTGKAIPSTISPGVTGKQDFEYLDQRIAGTFVLYPKPFGLMAEYNVGTGPEYDPLTNSIQQQDLRGGFILASLLTKAGSHFLIPFVRYHYYDGGKKHERDARSYTVDELEIGMEWQPFRNFEFVATYTLSERRFEDSRLPLNMQEGSLLRLHAQFNY